MLQKLKEITRPYRGAYNVLTHQGGDILRYIYGYVPRHREMFEPLRKFKNIHAGQRCFIVATGPSLTIDDVDKLKGEICWTCNSGIKLFDKTDWRPDYYAIGDGTVFRRIKDDLDKVNLKCAFYNHKDIEWGGENIYPLPVWVSLVMDQSVRRVIPRSWRKKKMSKDITKKVYMGGNVTNIIIQICFYMGFKEIYLLGCDCNYQGKNTHSNLTNYKDDDKLAETADYIYQTMIDDHRCALAEANKRGVKIYNATRGGMLEVYPRVDLDEVLKGR
jgi:hypothetical protein